ncbi:hypothetical protein CAC42_4699 [Sphaceloma murrayae]|uniref:Uncharacterized protein n=1 Tax=Sphaceloma murrayae TaxID=2082308 RepID=A0A2K1QNN9_9PEZI|nr:hypothetical protein CAC42_4699 [Sphaceloma murrayae]
MTAWNINTVALTTYFNSHTTKYSIKMASRIIPSWCVPVDYVKLLAHTRAYMTSQPALQTVGCVLQRCGIPLEVRLMVRDASLADAYATSLRWLREDSECLFGLCTPSDHDPPEGEAALDEISAFELHYTSHCDRAKRFDEYLRAGISVGESPTSIQAFLSESFQLCGIYEDTHIPYRDLLHRYHNAQPYESMTSEEQSPLIAFLSTTTRSMYDVHHLELQIPDGIKAPKCPESIARKFRVTLKVLQLDVHIPPSLVSGYGITYHEYPGMSKFVPPMTIPDLAPSYDVYRTLFMRIFTDEESVKQRIQQLEETEWPWHCLTHYKY